MRFGAVRLKQAQTTSAAPCAPFFPQTPILPSTYPTACGFLTLYIGSISLLFIANDIGEFVGVMSSAWGINRTSI